MGKNIGIYLIFIIIGTDCQVSVNDKNEKKKKKLNICKI